jgi:hypothetical protein
MGDGHRRSLVARPFSCGIALPSTLSPFPCEATGGPGLRFQILQTSMKYEARAGRLDLRAVSQIHTVSRVWIVRPQGRSIFVLGARLVRRACVRIRQPADEDVACSFSRDLACVGLNLMVLLCLPIVGEGK